MCKAETQLEPHGESVEIQEIDAEIDSSTQIGTAVVTPSLSESGMKLVKRLSDLMIYNL